MAGVHEARTGGSGAANGRRSRRRVVMFPLPFQGHINPMLQLGDVLHARGLAVTVLHTRLNAPDPARRHPEFQFVPVPDGVPAHVAASGNVIDIIEAMNAAMEADGAVALRAVLESVVADEARPRAACIVFDANLLAVPSAAAAVGLRTLVLRTASAACLGCFMAYPMLHQKGYLPPQGQLTLHRSIRDSRTLGDLLFSTDQYEQLCPVDCSSCSYLMYALFQSPNSTCQ
jgi:hypothetical protein